MTRPDRVVEILRAEMDRKRDMRARQQQDRLAKFARLRAFAGWVALGLASGWALVTLILGWWR